MVFRIFRPFLVSWARGHFEPGRLFKTRIRLFARGKPLSKNNLTGKIPGTA
jgi:hypothetical protein